MTELIHGDCIEVLRSMPDCSVDAVVTDPPYGLSFMGKKWDYDVPSVEVWAECLRVLKPGGHLLAFAGTRTQHRMAVRIEDAGFEIRDMIAWVYGSGFPKGQNVSLAMDKKAGAIGHLAKSFNMKGNGELSGEFENNGLDISVRHNPATDAAKQWQGWGTALKPALEPITVARKPLIGTVAENVLTWGTGGVNVEASRVSVDASDPNQRSPKWYDSSRYDESSNCYGKGLGGKQGQTNLSALGRWPANFIHDGSEEAIDLLKDSARFFYCAKASKADRGGNNHHPTVKPTDLMRYLCRLVTPPNGIVLDPFMGSGSTGKAAALEGFGFIGIEREAEYVAIAQARINHVTND